MLCTLLFERQCEPQTNSVSKTTTSVKKTSIKKGVGKKKVMGDKCHLVFLLVPIRAQSVQQLGSERERREDGGRERSGHSNGER